MRPSQGSGQNTENTIPLRESRRDNISSRTEIQKRRKRYRIKHPTSRMHRHTGNKAISSPSDSQGLKFKTVGMTKPLSSQVREHIRAQYQRWQRKDSSVGSQPRHLIASTYTGEIQIGGQEIQPSPMKRTGVGNKSKTQRGTLLELREVHNRMVIGQRLDHPVEARAMPREDTGLRQSTISGWLSTLSNNITTQNNGNTHLLNLGSIGVTREATPSQDAILKQIKNRRQKIIEANGTRPPSRSPSQRLGLGAEEIISFEHINVNGVNAHDDFVELSNCMGILENMEAGVYSIVETQWDTTCPKFCKYIRETMRTKDKYVKAAFSSNMDESYLISWKPGGTMLGVSGRWASRVAKTGNDPLGRWSLIDLRGKSGRIIRVISAYRVSQDSPAHAGETTSCKQQVRSLMLRGESQPNPKKRFLKDLASMITQWRSNNTDNDIILMADMNEYIGESKDLQLFCHQTNLIDSISLLNPDLNKDPTYLWGSKRIDYILISPPLAEMAVKAGHHNFNQHFISDHKGIYIQFKAGDLFETSTMDRSHASYRRLRMGRRDIVKRYIMRLEELYKEHRIWQRAEQLASLVLQAPNAGIQEKYFSKFDALDQGRVRYMHAAEKFAGSPPPNGVYEWSPLLESAGRAITYWKLRLHLFRSNIHISDRLQSLLAGSSIEDSMMRDVQYIKDNLSKAWQTLRSVQIKAVQTREAHIDSLAEHFAAKRNTTRIVEVKKIRTSERTRATAAKHKWYLKDRHGMIRNLLIPDYRLQDILSIIGALAFTLMIFQLLSAEEDYNQTLIIATGAWGTFTVWEQLTTHDGWKVVSDEKIITKRLLLRNGTHLSMSGDSPFARGPLAEAIGLDGEGQGVDEMLQGTFDVDKAGLDGAAASSEIHSF